MGDKITLRVCSSPFELMQIPAAQPLTAAESPVRSTGPSPPRYFDAYLFNSIEQVQAIADDWLTQYNEYRSHDALGGVPPKQFMPRLITTTAADSRNQLSA